MPQKPGQLGRASRGCGEAARAGARVEALTAERGTERSGAQEEQQSLMELAVERRNCLAALKRVKANKGSPGIDGMTVEELPAHLKANWLHIRENLLAGRYQPQPVRRVAIPKPGGGERELGIPTVLDRFIQQLLLQVLQPRFDPTFSDASYGFRPGRRAHDAVRRAQGYVQEGRRFVVDVDLEKFFDRVNHDVLMGRLERRIADKRMLGLIRHYLSAGMLAGGITSERHEGTPQGGPLSPLLANVLLDEIDKELERRGHAFVRYADDLNVYVRSKAAGERVMAALRRLFANLRLRVNEAEERGGASDAAAVPRLLVLGGQGTGREAPHRGQGHEPDEGSRAPDHHSLRRAEPGACVRGAGDVSGGMEGLLPDRRDARRPARHRPVDTPPVAGVAAQALEAGADHLS